MLHENPLMADIDVDHWRNLQALLLDSAKGKRRIIVIHDGGKILKFAHSAKAAIFKPVERITDAKADAKTIYAANSTSTDFVMVVDRKASDAYFRAVQEAWTPQDDIDVYVHRAFKMMDDYGNGIATYPGPASSRLGLQWRLGAGFAEVEAAVKAFAEAERSVVFGVFEGDVLWATLVLHFDASRKIDVVTTVDPTEIAATGTRDVVAAAVVNWVGAHYGAVCLGLFSDLAGARRFLEATDKAAVLVELHRAGVLIAKPLTAGLSAVLRIS